MPLLARLALLCVPRRAVRGRREVHVAEAAAPAAGDHHALPGADEVGQQIARRRVEDGRPGRHAELEVLSRATVLARARALSTAVGAEVVMEAVVAERRLAHVHPQVDRPPAAAVAAIRTASRDVRFPPERDGSIASVTGAQPDGSAVKEHRRAC